MSLYPCDAAYQSISSWHRAHPNPGDRFYPKHSIRYSVEQINSIITCQCDQCKLHRRILVPAGRQIGQVPPTQWSEQIRDQHRSLFALLIWIKKPALILPFVEYGVDDSRILDRLGDSALDEDYHVFQVIRANIAANALATRGVLVELVDQIESNWTDFLRPRIGERPLMKISSRFKLPFYHQHLIGEGVSGKVIAFRIYDGYNAMQVCSNYLSCLKHGSLTVPRTARRSSTLLARRCASLPPESSS